jgi:hypothetical protein
MKTNAKKISAPAPELPTKIEEIDQLRALAKQQAATIQAQAAEIDRLRAIVVQVDPVTSALAESNMAINQIRQKYQLGPNDSVVRGEIIRAAAK